MFFLAAAAPSGYIVWRGRRAAVASVVPGFQQAFSNPETQTLPVGGAKISFACMPRARVNPGETVLISDPHIPRIVP